MIKKINVYKMHCSACELLMDSTLNEIPWVKVLKVSHKNNLLEIEIKNEQVLDKVYKEIKKLWYSLENNISTKNTFLDYVIIVLFAFVLWLLYIIFKDVNFIKNIDTSNLSYPLVFLVWIVASLSSCLAITWGLIIWFSKYVDDNASFSTKALVQAKFHIWRILWFAILGWILWVFGWVLSHIFMFNKLLLALAWILMLVMWLNLLNIMPNISSFWVKIPSSISKKVLKLTNPKYAFIIWALSFFLPCWFTQSMQVYASSSWSFLSWALIMWSFALWTFPVLFLVGLGNSYFKDKNFSILNKLIWVIVVFFSIFILSWFTNFINVSSNTTSSTTETIENKDLVESKDVNVETDWDYLVPEEVVLSWAKNYKLTIKPTSNWVWCKYALTIPWLDENEYPIKKWQDIVLNLNNPTPWTYKVVCSAMWMYIWKITIK